MLFIFPQPQWVACTECGVPVHVNDVPTHVCDVDRLAEFQSMAFGPGYTAWLGTNEGRFAVFYAAYSRDTTNHSRGAA